MNRCIFCKTTDGPFRTREHILPESLGGGEWAILPEGLFCDSCQNKFGSQVEQQALSDFPFSLLRVFLGIPTKKRKMPWLESWEGRISGSGVPGIVGYDPSSPFVASIENGTKYEMRLLAVPIKPGMVCRTLLKMGLEVVAADDRSDVFNEKFDEARKYALTGHKTCDWWYLQCDDLETQNRLFRDNSFGDCPPVSLEVVELDDEAEVFHLRLFCVDMFVPLEARIYPDETSFSEPTYRLFKV
jgi:hypothetical protein